MVTLKIWVTSFIKCTLHKSSTHYFTSIFPTINSTSNAHARWCLIRTVPFSHICLPGNLLTIFIHSIHASCTFPPHLLPHYFQLFNSYLKLTIFNSLLQFSSDTHSYNSRTFSSPLSPSRIYRCIRTQTHAYFSIPTFPSAHTILNPFHLCASMLSHTLGPRA